MGRPAAAGWASFRVDRETGGVTEPKRSYYRLFSAYILASVGTGVAVVALSLLAFEMVGEEQAAAAVIGTALSIKTLAYVVGAPVATAFLGAVPRRPLMIALDLVRAGAIMLLPFVSAVWQLYALIAVFTLASAAFTPAYQSTVPLLLTDAGEYAKSLARSRVAGEFEGVASPLIAAALLSILSLRGVFVAAMAAFVLSAVMIAMARFPDGVSEAGAAARLRRGFHLLFRNPALRGLAPLSLAAGAGAAAAMVETVPIVRGRFGLEAEDAALALAVFGAGSVIGAVVLPRFLASFSARRVMLVAGALTTVALAVGVAIKLFPTLLALWASIGFAVALTQAPALAMIKDTVAPEDSASVYAANFSLSTAAAGLCFAVAGAIGGLGSFPDAMAALAGIAAAATAAAALSWRGGGDRTD
jgi:predicted MFS family arabinose efflux permease